MREIEQLPALSKPLNHARAPALTSPIVWLNLVCLDAPIVAITWQWFFARDVHVSLGAAPRAALFLTAWLIYLSDRLADTWTLRSENPRSLRQKFCQEHQHAWIATTAVIALAGLWIIFFYLDRATVQIGMIIGAISFIYLALNYWLGKIWRFLPVKEICIGCLFALGTAAAIFAQSDFSAAFIVNFFCFAALCSLNCISIAIWERDLDRAQGKNSIARRWHGIRWWFHASIVVLAGVAIIAAFFSRTFSQPYGCLAASALLLGMLDWLGEEISRDERTALADLVLLTPLFVLALGIA